MVRLRQAVLVAARTRPGRLELREGLGLGEPYRDPNVAAFGLQNVVFAIGTASSRSSRRCRRGRPQGATSSATATAATWPSSSSTTSTPRGARRRLDVRTMWRIDLPDISGTHLHPADMRAIVSLDCADPPESWRWAGPDWTGRAGTGARGRLAGIKIADGDPSHLAARWGDVLGVPASGWRLDLNGGQRVEVVEGAGGLTEIEIDGLPADVEIGGVVFRRVARPRAARRRRARTGRRGAPA